MLHGLKNTTSKSSAIYICFFYPTGLRTVKYTMIKAMTPTSAIVPIKIPATFNHIAVLEALLALS